MKYLLMFLMAGSLLLSCQEEENAVPSSGQLIGKWHMIELYLDPGDGSGSYDQVATDKYLEFKSDGSIHSNGNLCDFSLDTDVPTSGTYSLVDSTFQSASCVGVQNNHRFEVNGGELIVNYVGCFEPCRGKFVIQEAGSKK